MSFRVVEVDNPEVRSGDKGTSTGANVTSNPVDANTEALHVDNVAAGGASETKLEAVRALLATIDADTSNLDVLLSTRASEATLGAVETLLTSIDGKDFATDTKLEQVRALLATIDADTSNLDVALSTRATESTLQAVETLLTSLDGKDFSTETTLAAIETLLTSQLDVVLSTRASESTLTSIKDTDGVKKITDQLPAGTNAIGKVVLTDGTDDALVTTAGRLAVDMGVDAKGVVNEYLLDGGSNEMAVNAGGTDAVYEWNPGSNDVEGSALAFVIEDATIYFGDKFGGIGDLSDGVLIQVKASDVVYTISNVKTTREFSQLSSPGGFVVYSATPDHMKAELSLEGFIFGASGTYATADYVRVTIRDNLSGLSHMSALFKGREVT